MAGSIDFPRTAYFSRTAKAGVANSYSGPNISFKLLILFLLIMYSSVAMIYPQMDVFRPALTVAGGAILMMIVELSITRQSFRFAWPVSYLLAGFLGVAAISSLDAIYAKAAFDTTSDFMKVVLIYIVIENTITSASRLRTIMMTMVIGGLFPAIGTIHHYLSGILVEGSRAAWVGVFANPNEDAYSLVILVPLAAVLASGSRLWLRLALYGVIAAYTLAIYITFSRGGLLGLFAVLAIMGWKQKSLAIRVLMIGALVMSLILVGLFWHRKDDFNDIKDDTTFNQRIATIRAGWAMFLDRPLLGVGPGCSLVAYPLYVPEGAHCGCELMLVVHNAFIQVLSELGALGFIPWMAFIFIGLYWARRMQKSGPVPAYAAGLELAMWAFVVCGLSGGFSYSWSPYLIAGMIVAAKHISDKGAADCAENADA